MVRVIRGALWTTGDGHVDLIAIEPEYQRLRRPLIAAFKSGVAMESVLLMRQLLWNKEEKEKPPLPLPLPPSLSLFLSLSLFFSLILSCFHRVNTRSEVA